MSEPLPAGIGPHLGRALVEAEASLHPVDPKHLAVLLDRLFATLPMPKDREGKPDRAALKVWREALERFPRDLLAPAVEEVILTHKWETPPKIAQVVAGLRESMAERQTWVAKLKTAALKAKMTGADKAKPQGRLIKDMDPEEREAFFASMRERYPGATAMVERVAGAGTSAKQTTPCTAEEGAAHG